MSGSSSADPDAPLLTGMRVHATADVQNWSKTVVAKKDDIGVVTKIDGDGDAHIKWRTAGLQTGVQKKEWCNLRREALPEKAPMNGTWATKDDKKVVITGSLLTLPKGKQVELIHSSQTMAESKELGVTWELKDDGSLYDSKGGMLTREPDPTKNTGGAVAPQEGCDDEFAFRDSDNDRITLKVRNGTIFVLRNDDDREYEWKGFDSESRTYEVDIGRGTVSPEVMPSLQAFLQKYEADKPAPPVLRLGE